MWGFTLQERASQAINGATLCSPEVHGHCSACMQTVPGLGQVGCTQISLVEGIWIHIPAETVCWSPASSMHVLYMECPWGTTLKHAQVPRISTNDTILSLISKASTCCHRMHTVQCNTFRVHTVQCNPSWLHTVQFNTSWLSETLAHDTSHDTDDIKHTIWTYWK